MRQKDCCKEVGILSKDSLKELEKSTINKDNEWLSKNVLKNRVIVESKEGDRSFLLLEGDIFAERADVYIFNTYKGNSGILLRELKNRCQKDELYESPFYFSANTSRVGKIKLDDGRTILMLHSELAEQEDITIEQYEIQLNTVFTSLTALESLGKRFETVAFPILLRNSLSNIYTKAVGSLIEKATQWLKESEYVSTIKYVLYEKGDAEVWDEHLNKALGRRMMNAAEFSDILHYRDKALSMLSQIDQRYIHWGDTLLPIQNALQSKKFSPEVVAAFSRKFLEVYCFEKNKMEGRHKDGLDDYLKFMRQNKLLNPFVMQNLYQIRSFGNPSIHRPNPLKGRKVMNEKDVTILLICLCKLLELLNELLAEEHNIAWSIK